MNDNLENGWLVTDKEREPQVYDTCECCGEPIYEGDEYFDICGDKWCEDCIRSCKREA